MDSEGDAPVLPGIELGDDRIPDETHDPQLSGTLLGRPWGLTEGRSFCGGERAPGPTKGITLRFGHAGGCDFIDAPLFGRRTKGQGHAIRRLSSTKKGKFSWYFWYGRRMWAVDVDSGGPPATASEGRTTAEGDGDQAPLY